MQNWQLGPFLPVSEGKWFSDWINRLESKKVKEGMVAKLTKVFIAPIRSHIQ